MTVLAMIIIKNKKKIIFHNSFSCFQPVDISSIISERLSAVRKLQENPHDLGAKLVLDQAQKKVIYMITGEILNLVTKLNVFLTQGYWFSH